MLAIYMAPAWLDPFMPEVEPRFDPDCGPVAPGSTISLFLFLDFISWRAFSMAAWVCSCIDESPLLSCAG